MDTCDFSVFAYMLIKLCTRYIACDVRTYLRKAVEGTASTSQFPKVSSPLLQTLILPFCLFLFFYFFYNQNHHQDEEDNYLKPFHTGSEMYSWMRYVLIELTKSGKAYFIPSKLR